MANALLRTANIGLFRTKGMLVALAMTCMSTFSPSTTAQELPKLDIGVVLPLTGTQAPYGQEMLRGMELAIEQLLLAEPRLLGKIRLLAADEKSQPIEAAAVATQLIEKQRAQVIIGSITSPSTLAIAAVTKKLKHPLISPLSTTKAISVDGPVFRLSLDDQSQGALLAQFALSELKLTAAAILRDGTDSAIAVASGFIKAFQDGGGKIVSTEIYDLESDDFSKALTKVRDGQAPLILLPAYYQTAAQMMLQSRKLKLNAIFLGNDSWDTPELQKLAGQSAKGSFYTAQFAVDDPSALTAAFVAAFKTKYKRQPGVIAALGYDSVTLAVDAMRRANSNLTPQLIKALERTQNFQGVSGQLSLAANGDLIKTAVVKEMTQKEASFKTRIGGMLQLTGPAPAKGH